MRTIFHIVPLTIYDRRKYSLVTTDLDGFGGLVVSMPASGTQVCGFKPRLKPLDFYGRKNPQHAFLRNLSHVSSMRHIKEPSNLRDLRIAS